jgi:predicted transcriptional regulator
MSGKIRIGVGKAEESAHRFIETWHQAEQGKRANVPEERLVFEDLETLLRTLTPRRWALLKRLRREGSTSVRALARLLGRDYKNVHADVKALVLLGLIVREERGGVLVPWETVAAEMRLVA